MDQRSNIKAFKGYLRFNSLKNERKNVRALDSVKNDRVSFGIWMADILKFFVFLWETEINKKNLFKKEIGGGISW